MEIEAIIKEIMKEIQDTNVNTPPSFEGILRSWGEQKQRLFRILIHIEETQGTNISEDDIIEQAKKENIDEEAAQSLIDEFVYDGLLYRPSHMERMVRFHSRQDYCPWSQDFPS